MEVFEAIKTRRSIRRYKPDAVDEETLLKVLDAARWAPSWSNTQCWRFIVVEDNDIKAQLLTTLNKVENGDTFVDNPATRVFSQAPVIIVACAEMGKSGFSSNGTASTNKGDWFMYDVALAMQNLSLSAHALGLGTVHIGAFNAEKAAATLGIPEGFSVVAMTPLGYPEREGKAPPRKALSEIIFRNTFNR